MSPNYLHKSLSKSGAETLLRATGVTGAYLVRDSETLAGAYVLCLWSGERLNQYRILLNDEGLLALSVREGIRERHFATLDTLMQYYINLADENGLACALKQPVFSASPVPKPRSQRLLAPSGGARGKSPAPSSSEDVSPVTEVGDTFTSLIDPESDNITPFFHHRQGRIDLSVIDGEFIESLRTYIDDDVRFDADTASQPQYARVNRPSTVHEAVPRLHTLLDTASRALRRELQLYYLKLDVISRLFTPRDQELMTSSDRVVTSREGLEGLLKEMEGARTQVEELMHKARSTLSDLHGHPRELAYLVARMENENKQPESNLHRGLSKYVPPTLFEVKTYKGNLSQLKSVHLSIDLQSGSLTEIVPGQDGPGLNIPHHKIDQVIKSQVNSSMVEMKIEGNKKKKVLVFGDVRSREKFCQLVRTMKNLHMDDDHLDTVSVFVGSWNMGDEVPRDGLSSWLRCQGDGKQLDDSLCLIPHDLYVIGTQESATSEKDWSNRLKTTLFNMYNIYYQTVTMETLWGIRLVVLCKPCHVNRISHVETSTVKTGIANALGNKGAVGVSFDFNSTSICFVCCHLAARAENTPKRNQNYRDIVRGLCLGDRRFSQFDMTSRFHHLVWFGDLNYRVDSDIDFALQDLRAGDMQPLLDRDQLVAVQKQKDAFLDFSEEPITFRPTYRYEKGSADVYAWKKVKKTSVRINVPSWCDRVLWKSFPGAYTENLAYGCDPGVVSSDHRPVFCSLRLGVIQQFAAKMTSQTKQDDVILIFQSCEAEINSSVRQNYILEFNSTCLDGNMTSQPSTTNQNLGFAASSDSPANHDAAKSQIRWIKSAIPKLQPIVADRDFLEDQYLLISVRSADTNEIYGQCVLGLKPHISVTPQYFEARLVFQTEHTGILRGTMHVTSLSTAVNLSKRRRTARTYECVKMASGDLISFDEGDDDLLESTRPKSSIDLPPTAAPRPSRHGNDGKLVNSLGHDWKSRGHHGNDDSEEDYSEPVPDRPLPTPVQQEAYGDLSLCTSGSEPRHDLPRLAPPPETRPDRPAPPRPDSGPRWFDAEPPPPPPPRIDSLDSPCPLVVPTTGLPALISDWLSSLGLSQYQHTFLQHECTNLQHLDLLNDSRLADMGVRDPLHRKHILDSLDKVNQVNRHIVSGAAETRDFHNSAPSGHKKMRGKVAELFR